MNCLQYGLKFWKKNTNYRIWYNSDHCINLPPNSNATGFLPLEDFGFNHIYNSFNKYLTEEYLIILKKYFVVSE